jgi:hypothetical protein
MQSRLTELCPVARDIFVSTNLILSLCRTMLLRNNIITNRPMQSRLTELCPVARDIFVSTNLILSLCRTMLLRNNIITNRPMQSRLTELIKKKLKYKTFIFVDFSVSDDRLGA